MNPARVASALAVLCLLGACHPRPKPPAGYPITEIGFGPNAYRSRMLRGLYETKEAWRWSAPSFAVSLDVPRLPGRIFVVLDCGIPGEAGASGRAVTISARVNGIEAGHQSYPRAGRVWFTQEVPPQALKRSPATVEFTVDSVTPGGPPDQPRGLMVVSASLVEWNATPDRKAQLLEAGRKEYRRLYAKPPAGLTAEQDASLKKLFHELPTWESLQFLGISVLKNPLDLWVLQQIIYEVRPDYIIETGTFHGGSALYLAHVLDGLGLTESKILTVDIFDFCYPASVQPLWKKYVEFYCNGSTDPDLVAALAKRVHGKKVLVSLDSDHAASHVLNELHAYAPMVSKGSYIVVEDTHLDGVPTQPGFGPGPFSAITEFLREGGRGEFAQDFSRESFGVTYYPGGWLRRVAPPRP